MNKKLLLSLFTIFLISTYFVFAPKATNGKLSTAYTVTEPEKLGLEFLLSKLEGTQGLLYYLVEKKSPASYSVLESVGQAMEYAALIGDETLFSHYAVKVDKFYKDKSGYYYWKVDVNTKRGETSSAFVDDLRLVKAYFIAHEKGLGNYTKQLEEISDAIFKFEIDAKGFPCEYYDGKSRQKARVVPLFYLDIETLQKLSQFKDKWATPYQHTKNILQNMPENNHGFYPVSFKIRTGEYVWGYSINMVENLYTAINAFNAGRDTSAFASFLKSQTSKGKIYNHYYLNGIPVNKDESTAVYALAARFLTLHNEHDAAKVCYRRTLDFHIKGNNTFAGGFGESSTGLVYAFDQLEALLMLRMVEPADVRK